MRSAPILLAAAAALALPSCFPQTGAEGDGPAPVFIQTPPNAPPQQQRWTFVVGPCPGSTTGALWFDDRSTGYIGCGENASGQGLYVTRDGGLSWTALDAFEEVRVNDVQRGEDGALYAAGIHGIQGTSAWRLEGDPLTPVPIFEPSDSAFSVRQAENVAVTADGSFLVDSLTGVSAAYGDATGPADVAIRSLEEASLDDPETPGVTVRRVLPFNGRFYAVGSVINDPVHVRLPSRREDATYHLESIALQPEGEDGELLDMHIWSETRMIIAGFDQSYREPLVFVADGDPYDADNWTRVEIDIPAAINALYAVDENTVYAAGERVPTSAGGLLLRSDDGGLSWSDITPEGFGALSEIWAFEDGTLVLAGGGNEVWVGSP